MIAFSVLELVLVLVVLAAAVTYRGGRGGRVLPFGRWHRIISRHSVLAALVVGCVGIACASWLTWIRLPAPGAADEFAYILAADTYAHGRLTNPTHPLWEHFESFHVLQQPSYAAKYQPGQGLVMAAGQLAGGEPIFGVIASCGLSLAAACWMLQGWLPRRWALFGSLIVGVNTGLHMQWSHSYWGGFLPMLAGCLVVGAVPRFVSTQRARYAGVGALGVALFALTRPLEGVVLTILAFGLFLAECRRQQQPAVRLIAVSLLPAIPILAATAAFLAWNNDSVTGSWRTLPYQLHTAQYAPSLPFFLWQHVPSGPPPQRHAVMERFYAQDLKEIARQQTWSGFWEIKSQTSAWLWRVFLGVPLSIPFLSLPWVLRRPVFRGVALSASLFLAFVAGMSWLHSHYLAPAVPLLLLLFVQGFRVLRVCSWCNGRLACHGLVGLYLVICGFSYWQFTQPLPRWHLFRHEFVSRLRNIPGKDLVVVRYQSDHIPHHEWVYNEANIDAAEIVWAREMDAVRNRRLVEYFADRTVWLVLADADPPKLIRDRRATPQHQQNRQDSQSPSDASTLGSVGR
jgi:hypothetical protein